MTGDLYPLVHYTQPMILTVLYADGTEEAYSVSEATKLRGMRDDDFFYFTTTEGGQVAIAAACVERMEMGNLTLEFEPDHTQTLEDE